MKKSFCGKCEWHKQIGAGFYAYQKCFHPENSREARDPISEWECHPLCVDVNHHNDCKLFEPSFWERVKRFFVR